MSKSGERAIKYIFLISAAFCMLSSAVYPASKKKSRKNSEPAVVAEEKTAISSDRMEELKNKKYTYFSSVSEAVLADVETGSPSSLRRAASAMRKSEVDYLENEKVLLAVASSIMQMVYPSEHVDWETPSFTDVTPYMGAIQSAQKGIYDMSTGNVDFLTIVLPSLVITTADDVSPFFTNSENALRQGLSMRGDSVLAQYLLGLLYQKNNMPEQALSCLSSAKNLAPDCFQILLSFAECQNLAGNMRESYECAVQLLEKYPADVRLLKLCAQTAYALNNLNAAEEYISRVLQQEPNSLESLLFRAKILMAKKEYIRVASLLDMYSRQDTTAKEYLLLRTQLQYDWSKNLNAAVSTIENALRLYPDDKDVQLFAARLASLSYTKIAGKSAEEYADAVLQKEPDNEIALQYAADGFVQKKNYQKAYELSSALIARNKDDPENLFRHVNICLEVGKKDEAWNLIAPLYKEKSSDENVIQMYIITLDATGRDAQALSLINQLLPNSSSRQKSFLYYRRSLLQGDENAALSDLRSSLIANPRNSDALFRLYQIYFDKKDYRKAQYYLKQVVALNPNDEEFHRLNDELTLLLN